MFQIDISRETDDDIDLSDQSITDLFYDASCKLGITKQLIIEVRFVDAEVIKALNKEHRQIDRPTDVLSFPQAQLETSEFNLLGSIVISKTIVDEKNEDLPDVLKHGFLHLLGYDHEENEAKWNEAAEKIGCCL